MAETLASYAMPSTDKFTEVCLRTSQLVAALRDFLPHTALKQCETRWGKWARKPVSSRRHHSRGRRAPLAFYPDLIGAAAPYPTSSLPLYRTLSLYPTPIPPFPTAYTHTRTHPCPTPSPNRDSTRSRKSRLLFSIPYSYPERNSARPFLMPPTLPAARALSATSNTLFFISFQLFLDFSFASIRSEPLLYIHFCLPELIIASFAIERQYNLVEHRNP
jgi:hypothetical protein